MDVSIKIDGVKDFTKYMERVDRGTRAAILRATSEAASRIQADATSAAPVGATRDLRGSIQKKVTDKVGIVWSNKSYAEDVEFGKKPGSWAHVGDLMYWVRQKIKPPRNKLKSVTYLINRKIFEKGTDAQPFFYPFVKKWESRYVKRITQLINKIK